MMSASSAPSEKIDSRAMQHWIATSGVLTDVAMCINNSHIPTEVRELRPYELFEIEIIRFKAGKIVVEVADSKKLENYKYKK